MDSIDPTLMAAIVDSAPDGVLVVNASGRIVFANRHCEVLFGYRPEELVGQSVEILLPERLRDRHPGHRRSFQEHADTRPMGSGLELTARRRDGAEIPVEISLSQLETEDGDYVTAVARDVTERKILIGERIAAEEERQRLRAEADMQADRERIARDLHDGVMQAIYGVGLNLMDARAQIEVSTPQMAGQIGEAIDALRTVISDIRHYVMNLPLERTEGDVPSILRQLLDEFRGMSSMHTAMTVEDGLPALSDDQRLAVFHVTQEALANVRRHSGARRVDLRASFDGTLLTLEIQDNGSGFNPAANFGLEHMGLRNMHTRAEQLGGVIELESVKGRGTTLRLRLPVTH
jgi:PAS domain S-box-containing protein